MIRIPERFEIKLKEDGLDKAAIIYKAASKFGEIYKENSTFFFDEYTDHGLDHINSVLKAANEIITKESFELLSSTDMLILVSAIFLHDLGMQLQLSSFRKMVSYRNSRIVCPNLDRISWKDLWSDYLLEAKKFSSQKRMELFGREDIDIRIPKLDDKGSLSDIDKKLIGEFIRRYHPRIAHEVAISGLNTDRGAITFFDEMMDPDLKDLAGLVARSHGMDIRNTYGYVKRTYSNGWKKPYGCHLFYLMVVIRMADYFQIDSNRVLLVPFKTKTFVSPFSYAEHVKHLQTKYVQQSDDDLETLDIFAKPSTSAIFVALAALFRDIQKELDLSWAILGEIYGNKKSEEQPKILYRRVTSNLTDTNEFANTVDYIPEPISLTISPEISKLLISPLYGDDPSFGVRELIQNSVDACLERKKLEADYLPDISINIFIKGRKHYFSIEDNGIGMTLSDIKNYFLKVGGTFRKSADWYKLFVNVDNKATVRRSGRFGIGVLAAYLLGGTIDVETKNIYSNMGFRFSTTLQLGQIEVIKVDRLEVGTRISVQISPSIYGLLKGEKGAEDQKVFHVRYSNVEKKKFFEWYLLNYPQINYSIDGKMIEVPRKPYYLLTKNEGWNVIKTNEFADLRWKYVSDSNYGNPVICNGIVIPSRYKFEKKLIDNCPIISVFDYDARLPLSLNRNFFTSRLPFESKITEDIYRCLVYTLLTFNTGFSIDGNFLTSFPGETFNFPSLDTSDNNSERKLLYAKQGYVFNHHAFLSKLNKYKIIRAINVYDRDEHFRSMFRRLNEKGVSINVKGDEFIQYLDWHLSKDYYSQELPFIKKGFNGVIKTSVLEDRRFYTPRGDDFSLVSLGISEKEFSFQKSADVSSVLLSIHKAVQRDILYMEKYNSENEEKDELFSQIVDYYLGKDPIIPYNLSQRKKKFSKAFAELEKMEFKQPTKD